MKQKVAVAAGLILAVLISVPMAARAAHPRPGEYGTRGVQFNPAMLGIPLLDYFTGAPIQATGAAVNGRYQGLSPFGTKLSCNVCHFDIVANENMNRHATMSFSKITQSQYGYGYDKERPWVSGPGKFGSWSPAYNRQLGKMNTTYASEAELVKKLDLGAFEFTTECGVCHVGGGPGTSNPYSFSFPWRVSDYFGRDRGAGGVHSNLDNDQRNQSIANDFIFPLSSSSPYYPRRVPLNPWDFFVNKDNTVKKVEWAEWGMNGTLQLDCLMCHLDGYDHLSRNQEIVRYNRLYNAGTLGSGVAVLDPAAGDGFNMNYDADMVLRGNDGTLYLAPAFTDRITRFPKAENCVHCHMPTAVKNEAGIDWKPRFYSYDAVPSDNPADPGNLKAPRYLSDLVKRGDIWNKDELHRGLQCAGCHSGTGKFQAWKSTDPNYMHSPGKGYDPINIGSDEFGGTVKFCYDCHTLGGDLDGDGKADLDTFGAPNPVNAHAGAGLSANIVAKARRLDAAGNEVEFTGSHLDIISCTACHIQKRYAAARSIDYSTGGQFFNFVGNPLDQPDAGATVDLAFTWKETTPVRLLADGKPNPLWRRLIYPFNYVTGIYWNNVGSADANGDGFTTGMSNAGKIVSGDPFFQRDVKANFVYGVNAENNRIPTGLVGSGVFDSQSVKNNDGAVTFTRPAEIDAYQARVSAGNPGLVPQLVLESEPYLVMHNVAPSSSFALGRTSIDAGGKKAYGCSDCHGSTGGVYNGTVNMLGKGKNADGSATSLAVAWNDGADVGTKALYWDKLGVKKRATFSDATGKKTRDMNRWEFLGYDSGRVAALNAIQPAAYGLGVYPVAAIDAIADADAVTPGIQCITGTSVALSCPPGQFIDANGNGKYDAGETEVGQVSYQWSSSDPSALFSAGTTRNATVTFSSTGAKTVTLLVTDEEGNTRSSSVTITAVMPPIGIRWDSISQSATFSNLPSGTVSVRVYWGDGAQTLKTSGVTNPLVLGHSYGSTGAKIIQIYCYNSGGTRVGYWQQSITP